MKKRIVFIGFMGAGKTHMGRIIAEHYNTLFLDIDEHIEKTAGLSINEIFLHSGENYFRRLERKAITDIYKEKVIATGAGIIENSLNRQWLAQKDNFVVWLNPDWDTLIKRIQSSDRPKVRTLRASEIKTLWEKRVPLYQECADLTYNDDDAAELIKILDEKLKGNC